MRVSKWKHSFQSVALKIPVCEFSILWDFFTFSSKVLYLFSWRWMFFHLSAVHSNINRSHWASTNQIILVLYYSCAPVQWLACLTARPDKGRITRSSRALVREEFWLHCTLKTAVPTPPSDPHCSRKTIFSSCFMRGMTLEIWFRCSAPQTSCCSDFQIWVNDCVYLQTFHFIIKNNSKLCMWFI